MFGDHNRAASVPPDAPRSLATRCERFTLCECWRLGVWVDSGSGLGDARDGGLAGWPFMRVRLGTRRLDSPDVALVRDLPLRRELFRVIVFEPRVWD